MKIDTIIWLVLPLIAVLVVAAIAKAGSGASKPNKKSVAAGIVISALLIGSYIIFRSLFLGGF